MKNLHIVLITALILFFSARTSAQLIAHLPLDGTAQDISGNGNHGTATPGITYAPGRFGQAIYTGPGNDYIELANEAHFDFTGPMTICAWVKCPPGSLNPGTWAAVVVKGPSQSWRLMAIGNHWGLNGSHAFEVYGLDPYYIGAKGAAKYPGIEDGQWHHIVGVYDGTSMSLYTDGMLNKTTQHTGTPHKCDIPVRIGGVKQKGPIMSLNAFIDDVRIYDHALSETQIQNAMNNRHPSRATTPVPREGISDFPASTALAWSAPLQISNPVYMLYLDTDPDFSKSKPLYTGTKAKYNPNLKLNTTYYWRVDTNDPDTGTTHKGDTWHFTTLPPRATSPTPANGAENIAYNSVLTWQPEQHAGPYTHLLYMGTSPDTMVQVAALPPDTTTYQPDLDFNTTYYWQIREDDGTAPAHTARTWSFTVESPKCTQCGAPLDKDHNNIPPLTKYSCPLGKTNDTFPALPAGILGRFDTEGKIVFEQRPQKSWDFMATGTGVTGITVNAQCGVKMQLNHASAFDGKGFQRPLGVLTINDWSVGGWNSAGDPFRDVNNLKMIHDIKKSCIRVSAITPTGPVHMDIRANIEMDVMCIDITDHRTGQPNKPVGFSLSSPFPFERKTTDSGVVLNWHVNTESVYQAANKWSGFTMPKETDPLMGRCFGTAVFFDENYNTPGQKAHRIWIAADSTLKGFDAWRQNVLDKIKAASEMPTGTFIENHEKWWSSFWQRSYFLPEPKEGDTRFIKQQAAFDLYRYYVACTSSDRREFPVRFMNDLFRYNNCQQLWSVMDITALETYQSLYGAMRTGDASAMRSRMNFYVETLPLFQRHSHARFGHPGSVCAYETMPWGSYLYWDDQPVTYYTEKNSPYLRYSWSGNLWMILLMCDYVGITADLEFANNGIRPFASEVMTFFAEHYPQKDENGKVIFSPGSAGETWCGVKNPAEVICALEMTLPRLIKLADRLNWKPQAQKWENMLDTLPPIPEGKLIQDKQDQKWKITQGRLLVPAQDFSILETPGPINHQHTELFAIWPTKLYLRDPSKYDIALDSYNARMWKNGTDGWNLDVVFAACLGLTDEVDKWYDHHFDVTSTFPNGLCQETSLHQENFRGISVYPSMQGMGTWVIPVIERLMQDYPDEIILLPAWPREVPVRFALFSPFAGRVEVDYKPGQPLTVTTERPIKISLPPHLKNEIKIENH